MAGPDPLLSSPVASMRFLFLQSRGLIGQRSGLLIIWAESNACLDAKASGCHASRFGP